LLREAWRADITLFDPDNFLDQATFAEPHRYPTGPRTSVLVNGVLVLHETVHTGALPGHVLRRDAAGRVH
jgi:N-acyl-D-amino-acid deacylase